MNMGVFVEAPVGGSVLGMVGASDEGAAVGGMVVGIVVTALGSFVIVTLSVALPVTVKTGSVELAAPPLTEYVTTDPAGSGVRSSPRVHVAPGVTPTVGVPGPPVPGRVTSALVPSSQSTRAV